MNAGDRYHEGVARSDEDQVELGRCPDWITGVRGDDPARRYAELCLLVEDAIRHFQATGRPLPPPRSRPMQEVGQRLEGIRQISRHSYSFKALPLTLGGMRKSEP